jgi:hypothetical protein
MSRRRVRVRTFGAVILVFTQIGDNLSQALVIGFTMRTIAELIIWQASEAPPTG